MSGQALMNEKTNEAAYIKYKIPVFLGVLRLLPVS